jgi:diguanylate cyclase (GGDEF)-like protein
MPDDPQEPKRPEPTSSPHGERPAARRASYVDWTEEEEPSTRTTDTALGGPVPPVQRGRTRAVLTVISGQGAGRTYTLGDGETLIGRGKEAQVRINDAGTSRVHARISLQGEGAYVLDDLGSTNGTFVGGNAVRRAELKSGDRINIGPHLALSFSVIDAQAEQMAHKLYESSVRDPLTKAFNRRYLIERLGSEIAYARRHATGLSLILLDIDHFKRVNDTHGHLAGDDVLREVAALIGRMIRAEDVLARFGGEEFIVLARGIELRGAGLFAERIRIGVERTSVTTEGKVLRVTTSVGCASLGELPDGQRTSEGLIRVADQRLYRAKTEGRNRVCSV